MYMCDEFMFGEDDPLTNDALLEIIIEGFAESEEKVNQEIKSLKKENPKYWYFLGFKDCCRQTAKYLEELRKEVQKHNGK